jgi:hypothetical protein
MSITKYAFNKFDLFQHTTEVILLHDLQRCLTFALLVLQRAIEKKNARLLDATTHFWMDNVLG